MFEFSLRQIWIWNRLYVKEIFEKSVVSISPIAKGAVITAGVVAVKKPGTGIPAARLSEVIGKRARRAIDADAVLRQDDIDWSC